jgi:AraC-like DNA-binding protein
MTDPLSELVGLLRPRPGAFKRVSAAGRWALSYPAGDRLDFGAVQRGHCVVTGAFGSLELQAGDVLLLATNGEFRIGSDPQTRPVHRDPHESGALHLGSGEEATRILIGHFRVAETNSHLLRHLVPNVCQVRPTDPGAASLSRFTDSLITEVNDNRAGSSLIIRRLAEIMLMEVLRSAGHTQIGDPTMLRGLADPVLLPAIRALHADVARAWTVADLAHTAAVSRSVLAERFVRITGSPPMTYLTLWRMALGKEAIAKGGQSHTRIALSLGYGSINSFSTAFRRHVGQSPAQFARHLNDVRRGVDG